jgi:hypothetical protein
MPITEVDALKDFGLTLDHFYGLVKSQVKDLQVNQFIQLQATAIPLDISESYPWFSYGNLNRVFDCRLDPTPVADNIALLANTKLSTEYIVMLSDMLSLVEFKELDSDTISKIDKLQTKILNNDSRVNALLQKRLDDWIIYAEASMLDKGNLTIFSHWSQGHFTTRDIIDLQREQVTDQALISALRLRRYKDASDQAVVDAYAAATGPAARMRYPRFRDQDYLEEAKKFSPVYFAMLPDNDSNLFSNRQMMTSGTTLTTLISGTLGGISNTFTKGSTSSSSITTDWSVSGSGGWGPFSFSANASSHQVIKEDFSHTQSITVGVKSLQAVPIDASSWFTPDIFKNKLVMANRRLFERYFGSKGSLLYHPTHLIVARGLNIKFSSAQAWNYDYASAFSTSGGGSAKIFGVGWGANAKYSKDVKEQKTERRGNDLILDDGENIRILGYVATKYSGFNELLLERLLIDAPENFFGVDFKGGISGGGG